MNKSWKNFFFLIILSSLLVSSLFYIDSKQKIEEEKLEQRQEEEKELKTFSGLEEKVFGEDEQKTLYETEIEKAQTFKRTAWIPPWDYQRGLKSFNEFESQFHSISPVAFQINNDGTLKERLNPNFNDLKEITKEKDVYLIPTISNFDHNMMKNIFDSRENTQRHIHSILQVIQEYGYDGIDLDYESIGAENKDDFLTFVEILSKELSKNEKILSITVLPKWGDGVSYTGLVETREVQDWETIGKWADEVRIMAYDFTPPGNSKEGPIAPTGWIEKILDYAIEKIPKQKIWLGVHLYSYEWVIPTEDSEEKNIRTNSYTYSVVKNDILIHDYVEAEYNKEYNEGYASYTCLENFNCILYYSTPESVKTREDLAKKYNIAGVAYWRLGGEDELIK